MSHDHHACCGHDHAPEPPRVPTKPSTGRPLPLWLIAGIAIGLYALCLAVMLAQLQWASG